MGTADLQAAINSIPAKKDDLRKAFEDLEAYSSSFSSFNLRWKDIDDHISSIENSIEKRFRELEAKVAPEKPTAAGSAVAVNEELDMPTIESRTELNSLCIKTDAKGSKSCIMENQKDTQAVRSEHGPALLSSPDPVSLALAAKAAPKKPTVAGSTAVFKKEQDKPIIVPHPKLKGLCVDMDSKGLKSYIMNANEKMIRRELGPAILASPDPITLALDSFDGFVPSNQSNEKDIPAIRKACWNIVRCLHGLKLEIRPSDKERAREVAKECGKLITDGKKSNESVVLSFLQLVGTFDLLEYFSIDDILNHLVLVANEKSAVDICKNSSLEEKIPDLIEKLNSQGRQLDALKFVIAFNLLDKYPYDSLFTAYIKQFEKAAPDSNDSAQIEKETKVISRQIGAIKAVVKAVNAHCLRSVYPTAHLYYRIVNLENQKDEMMLLEKQKDEKDEKMREPAVSSAPSSKDNVQNQQHQQPNKRPRPSNFVPAVVSQPPHAGLANPFKLNAVRPLNSFGRPLGPGGPLGPPNPSFYPSEPFPGHAYYDRSVPFGGYCNSGFPGAYNPPHYP